MEESGGDRLTHASLVIQSADEGGRQAGEGKGKRKKRLQKGEGGFDAEPKLGQIRFQGLILNKLLTLTDETKKAYQ